MNEQGKRPCRRKCHYSLNTCSFVFYGLLEDISFLQQGKNILHTHIHDQRFWRNWQYIPLISFEATQCNKIYSNVRLLHGQHTRDVFSFKKERKKERKKEKMKKMGFINNTHKNKYKTNDNKGTNVDDNINNIFNNHKCLLRTHPDANCRYFITITHRNQEQVKSTRNYSDITVSFI